MNIYFDTEFTGLHKYTTLIVIGLIDENGNSFYAELTDYDALQVDEWIQKNVIDKLLFKNYAPFLTETSTHVSFKGTKEELRPVLTEWLSKYEVVILHSDCLMYDMVLFNDIWEHAFKVPSNISYIPIDLCTVMFEHGIDPDINRAEFVGVANKDQHNAMFDANVIKLCFEKIRGEQRGVN